MNHTEIPGKWRLADVRMTGASDKNSGEAMWRAMAVIAKADVPSAGSRGIFQAERLRYSTCLRER